VMIDAARCCKLALERGIGGAITAPSAYFMKSPPVQYTDDEAHRLVERFIAGDETESAQLLDALTDAASEELEL
jgi:myo-inositol-1-phosphate synthase